MAAADATAYAELMKSLATERAIYELLLKSSKRQHGRTLYFRKLDIAARHLARAHEVCDGRATVPARSQVASFNRVQQLLRAAFCEVEALLAQSYFMPFAITALASTARLATLSAHAAAALVGGLDSAHCALDPASWAVTWTMERAVLPARALSPAVHSALARHPPPSVEDGAAARHDGVDGDDIGAPVLQTRNWAAGSSGSPAELRPSPGADAVTRAASAAAEVHCASAPCGEAGRAGPIPALSLLSSALDIPAGSGPTTVEQAACMLAPCAAMLASEPRAHAARAPLDAPRARAGAADDGNVATRAAAVPSAADATGRRERSEGDCLHSQPHLSAPSSLAFNVPPAPALGRAAARHSLRRLVAHGRVRGVDFARAQLRRAGAAAHLRAGEWSHRA
ncbi:hypothetical protein KFE25_013583 [Diacronema lutheri]|uniref:Nucleolus and neural progenitor protein-like N-terminal domain-containing protein n=1 Tax=Diacronema lutheri TaxID=2081491 RepID=A0A8J6CFY5_DIALT|nr:hypothetical protein KFE25_013583 [Diacronema lutheri]